MRIRAKEIITEEGILYNSDIVVEGEIIKDIVASDGIVDYDFKDYKLIPALIDGHVHGFKGYDVMDADFNSINSLSVEFAKVGVGAFLATTLTAPLAKIEKALANVAEAKELGVAGAEIIGSYLEGPFFVPSQKGAHPQELFLNPEIKILEKLITSSRGTLKAVALAPEKEGSMDAISFLTANDITVLIGHTNADVDTALCALENGARGVVHCYNAMSGLHHRNPGVVGAALATTDCYCEMIADGHHVHPVAIKVVYLLKGSEKLSLITDCMRAGGLPNGEYSLGELLVEMKDGVVRTKEGALAGSCLVLMDGVKNMVKWLNVDFVEAVHMASLTPAKLHRVDNEIGSIKIGKKANLTVINYNFEVKATFVKGKKVF